VSDIASSPLNHHIKQAVQTQMLFLLDVTPVRAENGKQVLTLPDPLTSGVPVRYREADPMDLSSTRTRLFNPNWLVAMAKRDPINALYLTTATEDVLNNARVSDAVQNK
jgi:cobalamin biosynthesis Mg chelatase CobN